MKAAMNAKMNFFQFIIFSFVRFAPKTLQASLQNLHPIVDLNLGSACASRVRQPDGLVPWRAGRDASRQPNR